MSFTLKVIKTVASQIELFSEWTGRAVSWLVLIIALIVFYDVGMRYLFLEGSVALQELEWHLFALLFLFGSAYTLKHDEHVRVDIFFRSRWMSPKRRAWVNLLGGLFLLIPFCLLVIISSGPFVFNSYQFSEMSPDPGGLTHRYLLKAAIPVGFALLLLQGLACMMRSLLTILDSEKEGA